MVVLNHQYGLGRTVTARYFGTGDGSRVAFNLAGMDSDVAYVAPAIYKSDWAGNSLLYSTARTNLALQSQTFQTTWTRSNVLAFGSGSVVDAAVAPDGTTTAEKITEDGVNAQHYIYQNIAITAQNHTYSVFLKAAGRTWVKLQHDTVVGSAFFNLSSGAIGTVAGAGSSSIVSVGNGWYRCSLTLLGVVASPGFYIILASSDGVVSYAGDSTSGVYAWGAQLETGTVATPYIPTTTSVSVTDYSLHATSGAVTFASAPAASSVLAYKQPWAPSSNVYMRFGTGDGTSTVFSLPYAPVTPAIYVGGVLKTVVTDYTVAPSGVCTFTSAPAAAAVLTWTGAMGPMP